MSGDRKLWRVWTDARLLLWNFGQILLTPGLLAIKSVRYLRSRRPSEIDLDRWTIPRLGEELVGTPRIVLVAASFGELLIAERLAEALLEARPGLAIVYAVRDPKTVDYLRHERPGMAVVAWPFDFLVPVARWLGQVRPDLVVFTERFRFRNWCLATARYGAKVALVNGRCRPRTSPWYQWQKPVYRWQFGAFAALLMQRASDFEAVRPWAAPNCDLRTAGDFKIEHRRPTLSSEAQNDLEVWLSPADSPLIVAGSVDEEAEIRMVLQAFAAARSRRPCRLLIAPRELAHADLISSLAEEHRLSVSRRSRPQPGADVLVLDSLGELSFAYRYGHVAYVGGFHRAGNGGHNIVEPLLWKLPVAFGAERGNFEEVQKSAESSGAGTRISNVEELAALFVRYLEHESDRKEAGEAGYRMIQASGGALATTVEALLNLLP